MDRPPRPRYTGVRKHIQPKTGFSLRIPSDWAEFPMATGHDGLMFGPAAGTLDTVVMAEEFALPVAVATDDAAMLREGFAAGLHALPGIEIEQQDESVGKAMLMFEARFTFLEGDILRKRWVRVLYAGKRHLRLIAQGSSAAEFDYWLPMFYNIMNTFELWPLDLPAA